MTISNDVKFSPDARLIASASFDKSVRLWNGTNGQFMARLLGMNNVFLKCQWGMLLLIFIVHRYSILFGITRYQPP